MSSKEKEKRDFPRNIRQIGDIVAQGDEIARIYTDDDRRAGAKAAQTDRAVTENCGYVSVCATIPGIIRGLIRDGYQVTRGFKIADIDPRKEQKKNCNTISDKARCIAGSVVEVLLVNGVLP